MFLNIQSDVVAAAADDNAMSKLKVFLNLFSFSSFRYQRAITETNANSWKLRP